MVNLTGLQLTTNVVVLIKQFTKDVKLKFHFNKTEGSLQNVYRTYVSSPSDNYIPNQKFLPHLVQYKLLLQLFIVSGNNLSMQLPLAKELGNKPCIQALALGNKGQNLTDAVY